MRGMVFSGAEYEQNPRLREALHRHSQQQREREVRAVTTMTPRGGDLRDGVVVSIDAEPRRQPREQQRSLRELYASLHPGIVAPDSLLSEEETRLESLRNAAEAEKERLLAETREELMVLVA